MGKRLGYLMWTLASVIGIGFNIKDIYDTTRVGLPTPAWTAIAFGLFILGTIVVVHYRDIEFQHKFEQAKLGSTPSITLRPKAKLSLDDQMIILDLGNQMERRHGHSDSHGIQAEYLKGIDTNDILKRNCTTCGKPRNQAGESHYG